MGKKEARKNSGKPSKPASPYFLWLNKEGREAAQKATGSKDFGAVTKHAAAQWKTLPAAKKAPYEKEAAEKKDAYDKLFAEWKAKQGDKENASENEEDEDEDEDEE